ncbi:MAG: Ig-like domain-containing protein [Clostridia bacterium]|nr:Ig-like domain-containing protein [Clostridia bacterium]
MKRIISIIVSLLLAFSCLSNAFAATIVVEGHGSYVDDFEDGELSSPFSNWGDYAVEEGVGKDNSNALAGHRSYVYVDFNKGMTTDEIAVLAYDLKLAQGPTTLQADGNFLTLGLWPHNGSVGIQAKYTVADGSIAFISGNNTVPIDTDCWYHVVVMKESSAGGSGKVYLMDESGALLLTKSVWMTPGGAYDRFTPFNLTECGAEILVDNLELHYFDKSSASPLLKSSNITDGATGVLRNQTFRFAFNQALGSASVVTVTGGNADPVVVSKPIANYIDVSFEGLLERNTTYTISFEGVINASGAPCEEASISFTTEDVHVLSAPELGEVTENDAMTTVAFTLRDPYNYPVFSGIVAAAAYDENNSLLGFDLVSVTDIDMDVETELTFDFDLSDVSKVKIMAFDYANGLVPLAVGEKALS